MVLFGYQATAFLQLHAQLLEKLVVAQPVKESPKFFRNRSYITALRKARHCILSYARRIHSTPSHLIYIRYILI